MTLNLMISDFLRIILPNSGKSITGDKRSFGKTMICESCAEKYRIAEWRILTVRGFDQKLYLQEAVLNGKRMNISTPK